MRIGIFASGTGRIGVLVDQAAGAARDGFTSFWVPQTSGADALTALAVVGREVDGIDLGTAVVPIQPRHPHALASQALTVQAATGDRLTLGVGLSHQVVVEHGWGLPWDRPVRRMRNYLRALAPLLRGEAVDVRTDTVTMVGQVRVGDASSPSVLVAALGAQMLRLAGTAADGTITWCTGAVTLADHIVPRLSDAAETAGRAPPRVVAALPICLTNDVDGTRTRIADQLAGYGSLPSYRAMLDREGVDGPADIAVVGDEDRAFEVIEALQAAGVTDYVAAEMPGNDDEAERTRAFLRSLF